MSSRVTPIFLIATSQDCPACQTFKRTSYHNVVAKLETHFGFPVVIIEASTRTTDSVVEALKRSKWPNQRMEVLKSISMIIPHWPCIVLIGPNGIPDFQIYGTNVIKNGQELKVVRDQANPAYLIPNETISINDILTRIIEWANRYITREEYKVLLINNTSADNLNSPVGTQGLLRQLLAQSGPTSNQSSRGRDKGIYRVGETGSPSNIPNNNKGGKYRIGSPEMAS